MKLRKKRLRIAGLILLLLCLAAAIGLAVYFLFFYEEKEPEPVYTTPISDHVTPAHLSKITVTELGGGNVYTFDDEAALDVLLDSLQDIRLYRESDTENPTDAAALKATLYFDDVPVTFHIKRGSCTNSNGTAYDCADSADAFLDTFFQQVGDHTYSHAENIYQENSQVSP